MMIGMCLGRATGPAGTGEGQEVCEDDLEGPEDSELVRPAED